MSLARVLDMVSIWAIAGLALAIAGSSLKSVAAAGNGIAVASRIDRGVPVGNDRLGRTVAFVSRQVERLCEDRVDQAALKVAMRDLNRRNQATDYDEWNRSADRAGRLLHKLVACSPADGRLWAQLALVERAQVVPQPQVAAYARFSEETNPAEIATLRRRLELWRTAPPSLRNLIRDVAEHDMERVLRWAYLGDVRTIVASTGNGLQAARAATLPFLAPARREAIGRMKADLGTSVKPEGPRLYELPNKPPTPEPSTGR